MAISLRFRLQNKNYVFSFKLGFFLFCVFFVILFCYLGSWQLHRYAFKKDLLSAYQAQLTALPKPFNEIAHAHTIMPFQKVAVLGNYLNELTMLVENRFYQGQPGYEVITPLQVKGEKALLLINRGWIPKANTNVLASKKTNEMQTIQGHIKLLNEYAFILGKNISKPIDVPLTMQKIDINEIAGITHQSFFPFIVRLDPAEPNGFIREWVTTTLIPERHLGYSVQWFALALVVAVAFFCFCLNENHK